MPSTIMEAINRGAQVQFHQQKYQKFQPHRNEHNGDTKYCNGSCNDDSCTGTFSDLSYSSDKGKLYKKRSRKSSKSSSNCDNRQKTSYRCPTTEYSNNANNLQRNWSRDNIAETMEHFQPMTSPSSSSHKSSSTHPDYDYSYAYYEPGGIMCHSNIPTSSVIIRPSQLSSPKSIHTLLSQTKEKLKKPTAVNRHTYTTHYGTHENIYEDVSIKKPIGSARSTQSLEQQSCTKTEFQQILTNHYRVLEELNLSVEELLLSSTPPPSSSTKPRKRMPSMSTKMCFRNLSVGWGSSVNELISGEDSGFSGSSGASYIGSLRNYKTAITKSLRKSPDLNSSIDRSAFRAGRNDKFPNKMELEDGACNTTSRLNGKKISDSQRKNAKFSFWNKR